MRIDAQIKRIDHSLEIYPLEKRECFFANERRLKLFKSYKRINCEHECILNFTLAECGCVRVSQAKLKDTKICGFEDLDCYMTIINNWPESFYRVKSNIEKYPNFPCNCMPFCNQIYYNFIVEHSTEFRNPG